MEPEMHFKNRLGGAFAVPSRVAAISKVQSRRDLPFYWMRRRLGPAGAPGKVVTGQKTIADAEDLCGDFATSRMEDRFAH